MIAIFGGYRYEKPLWSIQAFCLKELIHCFEVLQKTRYETGYCVGYLSYEAGILLQAQYAPTLQNLYPLSYSSPSPLLSFTYFQTRTPYIAPKNQPRFAPNIIEDIHKNRYFQGFFAIKEHIKQGESYQVNFTQEILLDTHAKGLDIFHNLSQAQPTPYTAYIQDDFYEIISLSPELFFKTHHSTITTQPMKGTIKRTRGIHDQHLKNTLKNDIKNRSENVMIVDLLRNDMSKIASQNTLHVKNLFKILTYPTLHQMVSTIQARIHKDKTLMDLFLALFPCGSVTGAPKIETLKIIHHLEQRQRQIYCGAIGMISQKDILLNVPIRTLFRVSRETYYRYGVGSGIVWDSCVDDEFEELKLKSHFLFSHPFCLFETMRIHGKKIFLLKEHFDRILNSAIQLGFQTKKLQAIIQTATFFHQTHTAHTLPTITFENLPYGEIPNIEHDGIIHLQLSKKGRVILTYKPFIAHTTQKIRLASSSQTLHNDFLYHKTTQRSHYKSSQQSIKAQYIFDEIHYNEHEIITEGSRSNIIISKNNRYITPPIKDGLLAGTLRAYMIKHNLCVEESFNKQDLLDAKEIYLINSVRGIVPVQLG